MTKRKKTSKKNALQARWWTSIPPALTPSMLAGAALIIVAVFLVYLPSITGGFILDDDKLMTDNNLVKAPDGLWRFWCTTEAADYWPVTNTSFWIEWRLWKMNPIGYHVTNLVLHIVESLLIWTILRMMQIPGAFLAALIFAVHPVNVESVAWIAQRKNTMSMLFFLLSISWYLEFIKRARPWLAAKQNNVHCPPLTSSSFILHPSSFYIWYYLSLAAFVLAMLSKGSVVVLPVLLLGIVWWLRPLTRWDVVRTAPFFAVAVVLGGVNVWFQTHGKEVVIRDASFIERLLGAGGVVWFYLYKALLPIDLAFVYPQWHVEVGNPLWWLALMAAMVVTAVLWWNREGWSRPLLFAWGFFGVALVPVMGFTDVGFMVHSLVADHYEHIAIIGVIALASACFSVWQKRTRDGAYRAATIVAVAAVAVLAFLTWLQSSLYRSPMTLYKATLEKNPDCWMAHNNLGFVMSDPKTLPEEIEHYEKALRLKPGYADAHNNLGYALVMTGRPQEGIKNFRLALQFNPDHSGAHNNLGYMLIGTGELKEAEEHLQRALALKPGYPEALNNMGILLLKTGRLQEAINYFEETLRQRPDYPDVHNNLGIIMVQMGRPREAIEHFNQALRINPDSIDVYNNLASTYVKMHQSSEAIAAAQKALELARSQGQTDRAKKIEDWLNSYRAGLPK